MFSIITIFVFSARPNYTLLMFDQFCEPVLVFNQTNGKLDMNVKQMDSQANRFETETSHIQPIKFAHNHGFFNGRDNYVLARLKFSSRLILFCLYKYLQYLCIYQIHFITGYLPEGVQIDFISYQHFFADMFVADCFINF